MDGFRTAQQKHCAFLPKNVSDRNLDDSEECEIPSLGRCYWGRSGGEALEALSARPEPGAFQTENDEKAGDAEHKKARGRAGRER